MKITKSHLKQIVLEETHRLLQEDEYEDDYEDDAQSWSEIIKEETQKLLYEAEVYTPLGGYGQALANKFSDPKASPENRFKARDALFTEYSGYIIIFDEKQDAWVGLKRARGSRGSFLHFQGVHRPGEVPGDVINPNLRIWSHEPKITRRQSEPAERATGAKIRLPPHRAPPRSLDPGHEEELKKLDSNK